MAKHKTIATILNTDFFFGTDHILTKVEAREGFGFILNNVEVQKKLFEPLDDLDVDHCRTLKANSAYTFAAGSALIKLCNNIIESRTEEKKVEERPAKIKEVDDAINKFKEENKDNSKFITKKLVMQPATRYYSGKQGIEIANAAELDALSDAELTALALYSNSLKDGASAAIKEAKLDGWVAERTDYTPEGWRSIQTIKYNKLYELNKIERKDFEDKMAWIEQFDFHPGWNFESKIAEQFEEVTIDKLSEKSIVVLTEFHKEFSLNAINKDAMFADLMNL